MKTARICAALAAAGMGLALSPLIGNAEPVQYSAGAHVDTGLKLKLGAHGTIGTYTYDVAAASAPHATAYCIDLTTKYRKGAALREAHWADAPAIAPYAAQVNWLLHHSYPYLPVDQVQAAEPFDNGLSTAEAVTATQAAIWHYSNGVNLTAADVVGNAGEKHDVMALYAHLTGAANVGMNEVPDTSVSLTADGAGGVAGERIGPITLTTTTTVELTLTDAPAGTQIVDISGNPIDKSSPSAELYLQVPNGAAAGTAKITASAPVQIRTGRIFTPARSDAESATQSLVLATVESSTATAVITVPWTAAPTLGTTATDAADADKSVLPGGTVTDVVEYHGLVAGATYTIVGELIDVTTAEPTGATGSTTFAAAKADGKVSVSIPVSPSAQPGATLVVFERAYDATGKLVAEHTDLTAPSQTVTIDSPPPPPPPPTTPPTTPPASTTTTPPATPTPSTPTPTTSTAPVPPPTTTQPPLPSPSAAVTQPVADTKVLADTGIDATRWSLIAGALLMLGIGVTALGRRAR